MKINLSEQGWNGSINLNICNNGISASHNWKCHCLYKCCIYCEHRNTGCLKFLDKPLKCPSCLRIINEEEKGMVSSNLNVLEKKRYIVMLPKIDKINVEQKKKVSITGIEMTEYRNSVSQSTNNISAPLITPLFNDLENPLLFFNNLENILLENRPRENRIFNISIFIIYN